MCTTVSYFLPRGSSLFSYTGLFLHFRKKTGGGGTGPPAPPLATAMHLQRLCEETIRYELPSEDSDAEQEKKENSVGGDKNSDPTEKVEPNLLR